MLADDKHWKILIEGRWCIDSTLNHMYEYLRVVLEREELLLSSALQACEFFTE